MVLPSERGTATYDAHCVLVYIAALHLFGEKEYQKSFALSEKSPNLHRHRHLGRHRPNGDRMPAPVEG